MRIGILTGGGDVPGLNPCIKAVVNRVHEGGHQVTGIRRGWGGLLSTDLDDPGSVSQHLLELDPVTVRTVDRTGGTFLHSSRTNPGRVRTKDVPDFLAAGPRDVMVPESGAEAARLTLTDAELDPRPEDASAPPGRWQPAIVLTAILGGGGLAALIAWALLQAG